MVTKKRRTKAAVRTPAATAATVIKLHFQGLFAFCFNSDNSECQVGVLSTAPGHQLHIMVHKTSSNGEQTQYPITLGPALARLKDRIYLEIDGATPGIVQVMGAGTLDRKTSPTGSNENDLRWIIDYEGPEVHDRSINIREGIIKPIFHLSSGYFYTRSISPKRHTIVKGSQSKKDFGYVGESIGADISVEVGSQVRLRIVKEGAEPSEVILSLGKIEADCMYEVSVINSRPGEFQTERTEKQLEADDRPQGFQLTDMQYYYHALDIPATDWIDFQEEPKKGAGLLECYSMRLSRTESLP